MKVGLFEEKDVKKEDSKIPLINSCLKFKTKNYLSFLWFVNLII
jgi:hypothetical protein